MSNIIEDYTIDENYHGDIKFTKIDNPKRVNLTKSTDINIKPIKNVPPKPRYYHKETICLTKPKDIPFKNDYLNIKEISHMNSRNLKDIKSKNSYQDIERIFNSNVHNFCYKQAKMKLSPNKNKNTIQNLILNILETNQIPLIYISIIILIIILIGKSI